MSRENELTDHEYDGIQEYDNPLPNWWLVTFFATIIFAFIYWLHYEIAGGPTLAQELSVAMKEIDAHRATMPVREPTEQELAAAFQDPGVLSEGGAVFAGKCASCHGPELQGLIGPNLTDAHWLQGKGTAKEILRVVRVGVPAKGMPPWEGLLKPSEITAVTVFIQSKIGSNPPNPKEPQGQKVE